MSIRSLLSLTLLAALSAASLSAAPPFVDNAVLLGKGFGSAERTIGADTFGGAVGTAVDPTDPDAFYYYDGAVIRRYDFRDSTAQGTGAIVFSVPVPTGAGVPLNSQGRVYGTFLAFDSGDGNALWFAESSLGNLYRITISALDRSSSLASAVVYTAPATTYLYDVAFDTTVTPRRVLFSHTDLNGDNNLMLVNTTVTPFTTTPIAVLAGASGPLDFDSLGNLYYVYPESSGLITASQEAKLVSWTAAQANTAMTGGAALTQANMVTERTIAFTAVFSSIPSILARRENNQTIIYGGNSNRSSVMRINIGDNTGASDDLDWTEFAAAGILAGKLATSSKTAGFASNAGQYDEGGSTNNARIVTVLTEYAAATTASGISLVPNNTMAEIADIDLSAVPSIEHTGVLFSATVAAVDAGGTRLLSGTGANVVITAALQSGPPGASLAGTLSRVASFGQATFNDLAVDEPGNYTIRFSVTGGPTKDHTLIVNEITEIAFSTVPAFLTVNTAFGLTAAVRDAQHLLIANGFGATAPVLISILSGPIGGTLNGTTSVAAAGGVVNFAGLTVSQNGNYVLRLTTFNGVTGDTPSLPTNFKVELNAGGGGGCAASTGAPTSPWILAALAALLAVFLLARHSARRSA